LLKNNLDHQLQNLLYLHNQN